MIVLVVMIIASLRTLANALKSPTPTVVEGEAVYKDPVPLSANAPH
jgi:carbon starvation protein